VLNRQVLEGALALLAPDQRQAVTLRFLDGLNLVETGVAMDRSVEAVKKLQARGLANHRRLLSRASGGRPIGVAA
jgi:RNA polymerase sigma-70 factor (ECF subfamily)